MKYIKPIAICLSIGAVVSIGIFTFSSNSSIEDYSFIAVAIITPSALASLGLWGLTSKPKDEQVLDEDDAHVTAHSEEINVEEDFPNETELSFRPLTEPWPEFYADQHS